MMKRDRASAALGCGCGSSDHLLHSIHHRGVFHRLCTSCVLRFHLGSFCPVCLQLFHRSAPSDSIKCSKCPSFSHSSCAKQATPASYVCPSCLNPNSLGKESMRPAVDLKSATALVAAAQLASLSMSRAAAGAKVEAERKARESALSRKRAREALERFVLVASRGKASQEVVTSVAEEKKTSRGSRPGTSVTLQKRVHNRKLGGGPKTSGLSLGIQQTGTLVRMQGKEGLAGSASVSGHHDFQNYVTVDQREKLGDSSPRQFYDIRGKGQKANDFRSISSGESAASLLPGEACNS